MPPQRSRSSRPSASCPRASPRSSRAPAAPATGGASARVDVPAKDPTNYETSLSGAVLFDTDGDDLLWFNGRVGRISKSTGQVTSVAVPTFSFSYGPPAPIAHRDGWVEIIQVVDAVGVHDEWVGPLHLPELRERVPILTVEVDGREALAGGTVITEQVSPGWWWWRLDAFEPVEVYRARGSLPDPASAQKIIELPRTRFVWTKDALMSTGAYPLLRFDHDGNSQGELVIPRDIMDRSRIGPEIIYADAHNALIFLRHAVDSRYIDVIMRYDFVRGVASLLACSAGIAPGSIAADGQNLVWGESSHEARGYALVRLQNWAGSD